MGFIGREIMDYYKAAMIPQICMECTVSKSLQNTKSETCFCRGSEIVRIRKIPRLKAVSFFQRLGNRIRIPNGFLSIKDQMSEECGSCVRIWQEELVYSSGTADGDGKFVDPPNLRT